MKKIMSIILVIVITAMCFTACGKNKEEREEDIQELRTFIITDEETGVQYIVYRENARYGGMGGITPRYNSDGTLHTVNDKEKTDSLNIKKESESK